MKNKDLQVLLANGDPEADVYFEFNGCTESGERLDITDVEPLEFVEWKSNDIDDMNICVDPLDELVEEEITVIKKWPVIRIYSNRQRYEP